MTSYIEAVEKLIDQQDEKSIRIRELEAKVKLLEKVELYLKTSYPEKSGYYFICGEGGVKDDNGLPERLHVCPAYGADWMMLYTRTDKTTGPEW
jgi:hypothetical protein